MTTSPRRAKVAVVACAVLSVLVCVFREARETTPNL
jgi:hypothetical protein